MQDDFSAAPIQPTESSRIQKQEQMEARKIAISQEASSMAMTEFAEDAFNPVMLSRRFQTLEERLGKKASEKKEVEKSEELIVEIEQIESLAEEFRRKNPELESRSLMALLAAIKASDSPEEILRKVMEHYPDPSLADESLEFLERTASKELQEKVKEARANLQNTYGREVAAGRNMGAEARAFSQEGLGTPTGLRDLYRDITGNPRPATALFEEFREQFDFEKMETAINFLLHSLGSDMKAKGPSIAPGQLHTLVSESRNLLAVLWVYRFFRGRMDLISSLFNGAGMLLPSRITFEMLAKMFVQFLLERYPSMDKVLQLARKMGISADVMAQIIIFGQMRDAVRGVAPKLYRTQQHRHDVLMSFLEALEELEDQLEEEEEGGEEEDNG